MSQYNPLSSAMLSESPKRTSIFSAWNEHLPFAMALVEMLRPRAIAELGTHAGISYSAFCQTITKLNLPTHAYAVDSWAGDDDTGPYGTEVYPEFAAYHEQYSSFSKLLRMTFDEALAHVPDGSIDLLHVDGLHTYEAVRHDFETWQPKLTDRGIVIFHDIAVVWPGFGVKRYWEEISAGRPSFGFEHGHGLGVLGWGSNLSPEMSAFFEAGKQHPDAIRAMFAGLGKRIQIQTEATAPPEAIARQAIILEDKRKADARLQANGKPLIRRAAGKVKRTVRSLFPSD